jgi:hypothetical protein
VTKITGLMLVLIGVSGLAMASSVATPEINPASAATALALLSGVLLVLRGRRNR